MSHPINIAITGANGRMGRELISTCAKDNDILLSAALVRSGHPFIGKAITELVSNTEFSNNADLLITSQDDAFENSLDVLIDFTLPENTILTLQRCIDSNMAIVIGTTGFTQEQQNIIDQASSKIPVLQAPNMSVGVNLTLALLKQVADVVGDVAHIEINETHHIHKIDRPSGTANTMGEVIANSLTNNIDKRLTIKSKREGEVVGDHSVSFTLEDEQIKISHRAFNRVIFAQGALRAAKWIVNKEVGIYSMKDVLGLIT
jgi:4-hydroxy-tetrahydrodipicolinate reductase